MNERHRAWYQDNREKSIANVQRWREQNPEKYQAWLKRNREENKEKRREQSPTDSPQTSLRLKPEHVRGSCLGPVGNCAICGVNEDLNLHVDHDKARRKFADSYAVSATRP